MWFKQICKMKWAVIGKCLNRLAACLLLQQYITSLLVRKVYENILSTVGRRSVAALFLVARLHPIKLIFGRMRSSLNFELVPIEPSNVTQVQYIEV